MTKTMEIKDGWVVYGGMWCGFCRKARKMLDLSSKVDKYIWNEVPKDETREKIKDQLKEHTNNCRTFPMIFHNKKFVGGSDKLKEYLETLESKKVGGLGEAKPVDQELSQVCKVDMREDLLKALIEDGKIKEEEKKEFNYEPYAFKTQLVNGVNYFVGCAVTKNNDIHLRLHKSFNGKFSFVNYLYPVDPKKDIEYF